MLIAAPLLCRASALDFSAAVVVVPANLSGPEKKSVEMLVEEVEKRTAIRWLVTHSWPAPATPVVAVGPVSALEAFAGSYSKGLASYGGVNGPEGYRIRTEKGRPAATVIVIGNDSRGVLFGVGRLLRTLRMTKGSVSLPDGLDIATSPAYALRGHQLGYRPKSNTYDGWTPAMFEQYIRDLAVFGTNAIEIIPPRSDDAPESPLFPLPPMKMMVELSALCNAYNLDVWIWYPAMDKDYSDPKTVEFALKEWGEDFKQLPRIDAVFVPGGDPGHTQPKYMMALLEKQTENLHRYHPKAQMWVSPQGFNREWLDEFYGILKEARPAWLTGVVYGPQIRASLPQLRATIPEKYPIRFYPDITHSLECQFPVPDWDTAYALTENREVINPRPLGESQIFRLLAKYTIGFITYSEGSNDDVNKIIWSALGWDPNSNVTEILREFSRYFIGDRYTDDLAQGLLALERNWQGPLLANQNVYTTLDQFRSMEQAASPEDLLNWRFQQLLYRAYYDAYTRSRLLYESDLEDEATGKLREARRTGSVTAMAQAEAVMGRSTTQRVSEDWRARVFDLAEALFKSIRMQLSVERYHAISIGRGATLDTLDVPLNNRPWLEYRFAAIRKLSSEADRLKAIDEILHWTNPGPGGFYDELGNPTRHPHLVQGRGFGEDPDYRDSALTGFGYRRDSRISWMRNAESLYDAPLKMRYTDLDTTAQYKVRVVYAGDSMSRKIRLVAANTFEIHPLIKKPLPIEPLEYDIPAEATKSGELTLAWYGEPGLGGNGRGCQVAEVWLIKK